MFIYLTSDTINIGIYWNRVSTRAESKDIRPKGLKFFFFLLLCTNIQTQNIENDKFIG